MRIVFFGSGDFACVHLKELLKSQRHRVAACVTQPDKPQGRGMKLERSAVKEIALAHGLTCLEPTTLKNPDLLEELKGFYADLFVVVSYGKILSAEILAIPKIFCVNVHASLLPRYRGAAPINWAILNGNTQTGVSVQKIFLGLDAGDIIAQAKMPILPEMGADILRGQMAVEGARLLIQTLDSIEAGKYTLTPQDPAHVSFAPKLTKEMGKIDWNKSAVAIFNQIRGLRPWPGTYTFYQNKVLKVLAAQPIDLTGTNIPGQVIAVDKNGFTVACGQGGLLVTHVQPEAGKVMSAFSFVSGHKFQKGFQF